MVWVFAVVVGLVFFVLAAVVNRGYRTRAWERRARMGSLPRGRKYESDN